MSKQNLEQTNLMKSITVSAPGKLMLFGEHAVVYGKPCIVTTVDARMIVEVVANKGKKIKIEAPQMGVVGYERNLFKYKGKYKGSTLPNYKVEPYTKRVEFIEAAIENFTNEYDLPTGLSIEVKNSFSRQYGLGSSSAITVCVIKALSEIFKIKLSKKEIFDLAYRSVLQVQGVGSGFDVAANLWGGTIFYQTKGPKIIPLKLSKLPLPLVVVYSGVKAKTPVMIKKVRSLRFKKFKVVEDIFDKIEQLVRKAKICLEKGDWPLLGEVMNENQKLLEPLGVSTAKINQLIAAALKKGAWGAKISGAGGGDCIIVLVEESKRQQVEQSLIQNGGILIPIKPGAEGVRREK